MKEIVARHIIDQNQSVREALVRLDEIAPDSILFVTDTDKKLLGSLTDGDLRRGFIKGLDFSNNLLDFVEPLPVYLKENAVDLKKIEEYRNNDFKVLPIINEAKVIVDILIFSLQK